MGASPRQDRFGIHSFPLHPCPAELRISSILAAAWSPDGDDTASAADGNRALLFQGELYNSRDLRRQLDAADDVPCPNFCCWPMHAGRLISCFGWRPFRPRAAGQGQPASLS